MLACLHIARVEGFVAAVNNVFDIAKMITHVSHVWKRS